MLPTKTRYAPLTNIPDLGEFNETIPQWGIVHAFAWYAREASSLPPAAHTVGAILPVLAHEAARRGYKIGPKRERPALQTALVGSSGTGKSTSMRLAQKLYRDYLQWGLGQHYIDPWMMVEGSIPGILEQLAIRHNATADSTIALLYSEEFTRVLQSKDSVAEVLNQIFDGESFARHLRQYQQQEKQTGWAPKEVRNPAVSALFATTYAGIETATTKLQASGGFYSRMLWFAGPPLTATFDDATADDERTAALAIWSAWAGHMDAREVLGEPKVLDIGADCKDLFAEPLARINEVLKADPEDALNAVRLRGLRFARTVASLFAFSRGELVASIDDTIRALRLVEATIGMTTLLADRWATEAATEADLKQQPLLDVIRKAGKDGVRKGELYRIVRSKPQLDLALQTLVDKDLIEEVRVSMGPGRPTTLFRALINGRSQVEKPN